MTNPEESKRDYSTLIWLLAMVVISALVPPMVDRMLNGSALDLISGGGKFERVVDCAAGHYNWDPNYPNEQNESWNCKLVNCTGNIATSKFGYSQVCACESSEKPVHLVCTQKVINYNLRQEYGGVKIER